MKLQASGLAQLFSWEFSKVSKNTFFIEHLWWLLLFLLNFVIAFPEK